MKIKTTIYTVLLAGLLLPLINNCKKEAVKTVPIVSISATSNITATTATVGGEISADGGDAVTDHGVCWSANQNPTISDNKTSNGSGAGSFTNSLTGLTPGATYNLKAYATNSVGTGYSSQLSFTTLALAPVITTANISAFTSISATGGGNITSDGGSPVTARGVCWSTSASPTIANSKTTEGTGAGIFSSNLSGLTANTTYYVRAYATNSAGTGYGIEVSFKTSSTGSTDIIFNPSLTYGTVSDIDGNVYKTIQIGTQIWMAENLKTTKYRNGDPIPNVTVDFSWAYLTSGGSCWYNNDVTYKASYGALYNWYAVTDSRNIAPTGWHVPSDAEWKVLEVFLGMTSSQSNDTDYRGSDQGGKLKEAGTSHWSNSNMGATNSSGFTALPVACRLPLGTFSSPGLSSFWWSCTDYAVSYAWDRIIARDYANVWRGYVNKQYGFSVRCVKD